MSGFACKCGLTSQGPCRPCFVYVVCDKGEPFGAVKVGIAFKPTKRLAQHRKKTGRDLAVHHRQEFRCEFVAADVERRALMLLSEYRFYGDWFNCSIDDAVQAVEKARRRR